MRDTRAAIRETFMREYAHTGFDRITVKGLCAATPVARTTFYAHYGNTADVREEVEEMLVSGLQKVADEAAAGSYPTMEFSAFLDGVEAYITAHWDWFHALLIDQPDACFALKWKAAIKENFARRYPDKRHMRNYDLFAEMVASAVIGGFAQWMRDPDGVDVGDVKVLVVRALDAAMPVV